MKSYTDLEQSKKLSELLPLESADMYYEGHQSITNPIEWEYEDIPKIRDKYISFYDKRIFHPCWSLTALLEAMPEYIRNYDGRVYRNYHLNLYRSYYHCCSYSFGPSTKDNDDDTLYCVGRENWVDACVDMIIKLKELKML